jgi:hypothetical protein
MRKQKKQTKSPGRQVSLRLSGTLTAELERRSRENRWTKGKLAPYIIGVLEEHVGRSEA